MKIKSGLSLSIAIVSLVFLASCVTEDQDDCPSDKTLTVVVKDKNYDNADALDRIFMVSENLPLSSYTGDLLLWWQRSGSEELNKLTVTKDLVAKVRTLALDFLSPAAYDLWITASKQTLSEDMTHSHIELHPDHTEYSDIYIGHINITAPLSQDQVLQLFRLKGKLLIQPEGFTPEIAKMEVIAEGVSAFADGPMLYEGSTSVSKLFELPVPATGDDTDPFLELILAPSSGAESHLTFRMLDADNNTLATLSGINVSIIRNRFTVIRPTYAPDEDIWEVSVLIDGEWQSVHTLTMQHGTI